MQSVWLGVVVVGEPLSFAAKNIWTNNRMNINIQVGPLCRKKRHQCMVRKVMRTQSWDSAATSTKRIDARGRLEVSSETQRVTLQECQDVLPECDPSLASYRVRVSTNLLTRNRVVNPCSSSAKPATGGFHVLSRKCSRGGLCSLSVHRFL